MISEIPHLYILLLVLINAIGFIGVVILNKNRKQFSSDSLFLFAALTIGITLTVIITSIIVTNFKTINCILLIIGTYLLYNYKKKNNNNNLLQRSFNIITPKKIIYRFIELNIVVSIIFLIYACLFFYKKDNFSGLPHPDLYYYSRVSSNILNYSTETNAFVFTHSIYPAPYHYFDIWINVFVSFFQKTSLMSFVFITTPMFFAACYFGIKTLILDVYKTNNKTVIILALAGFVLSGVYIYNIYDSNYLMSTSNVFTRNIINYQKLAPFYLFLLWAVYFLKHKKTEAFFISLTVICICYISATVVVSAFCLICIIYSLITKNKVLLSPILKTAIVLILIVSFYYFLSDKNEMRLKQAQELSSLFNFYKIKTGINIFIKTIIQFSFLYAYLIFIFLLNFKKNNSLFRAYKFELTLIALLCFSALISWAFFSHIIDSVQFFSNLTVPLLNIITVLFISFNLKTITTPRSKILLFILLACVFMMNLIFTTREIKVNNNFSETSLIEFKNRIYPKLKTKKCVYIRSAEQLNTIFARSTDFGISAPQLLLIDNFEFISLSVFDSKKSKTAVEQDIDLKIIQSSYFYKYSETKLNKEDISKLKTDFILKNKIQLLVITDGVILPYEIRSLITDSINDAIAKENYYLLEHN